MVLRDETFYKKNIIEISIDTTKENELFEYANIEKEYTYIYKEEKNNDYTM
ncbi:MAG: hypothetical protein R3Y21_04485 [Mycoplasmatota bacterium]